MKLHVLSDLHLGVCPLAPARVCADALILAGDISDGRLERTIEFSARYLSARLPVLYVPGNHEYWGHHFATELKHLHRDCRHAGITLLHNRVVVLEGVRLAGSTLWTDFVLGEADETRSLWFARQNYPDYREIKHGRGFLWPDTQLRWHRRAIRFLDRVFATPFSGRTVVITHHGVHPKSVHERWKFNPLNPCYVSDLSKKIEVWRPSLMVHGHVHHRVDYRLGETRVIANPRGYSKLIEDKGELFEWPEHDGFDPQFVISI